MESSYNKRTYILSTNQKQSLFPALGLSYIFSHDWHRFHVSPRLTPVTCFTCLKLVNCFPALGIVTCYMFPYRISSLCRLRLSFFIAQISCLQESHSTKPCFYFYAEIFFFSKRIPMWHIISETINNLPNLPEALSLETKKGR